MTDPWIDSCRGGVAAWEVDHVGHFTVAYYHQRIEDAGFAALGGAWARSDVEGAERRGCLITDCYVRYLTSRAAATSITSERRLAIEETALVFGHMPSNPPPASSARRWSSAWSTSTWRRTSRSPSRPVPRRAARPTASTGRSRRPSAGPAARRRGLRRRRVRHRKAVGDERPRPERARTTFTASRPGRPPMAASA